MRDEHQAIVIGGGVSGLTAAALLAKRGVGVLVLERSYMPGGACGAIRRRGVTFDMGAAMLFGFGDRGFAPHRFVMNELEEPVEVIRHAALYRLNYGREPIVFWPDRQRFYRELETAFPEHGAEIRAFYAFIVDLYENVIQTDPIFVSPSEMRPRDLLGQFLRRPIRQLRTLSLLSKSAGALIRRYVHSEQVIRFFDKLTSTYCYTTMDETPAILAATMFVDNHTGGSYYPVGSAAAFSGRLEKAIERLGGDILYETEVTSILFDGRRVRGVRTKDEREYAAPRVIYSGAVQNLYSTLLPPELVPAAEKERIAKLAMTYPSVVLYGLVEAEAIPSGTMPVEMKLGFFALAVVLYQLVLWLVGFLLLWRIPRCRSVSAACPKPGPSISVIIPARNEERNLPALLRSLDAQDLRPAEVIVVDDGSQDGTAEAARLRGARLLPAGQKPPDWVGKSWACWKGAQAAAGDILVFLDADTVVSKSGLAAIAAALAAEGGLVSVQPFHSIRTPSEVLSAYFNVVAMAALNVFSPLGDRLRPAGSFGPCIAVRRTEYFAAGGHEAVKGEIAEDMALGKVFQDRGVRVSCFGGKEAVSFRMYPGGLRDIAEGWTKNFALGSARTHPVFLALVVAWIAGSSTCFLSLLAILSPVFRPLWPAEAALYLLYAAQLFWMLRRIGSFGPLAALLFPLPLLFFHGIFFRSVFLTRVRNRVTWRGRTIPTGKGERQSHG